MARRETRKVGDGGDVVIPADFRRELGIKPGDQVTFEDREGEIVLRSAKRRTRSASRSSERGTKRSSR